MAANKDIVAAVNRNGCVTVWTAGDLEKIFSSELGSLGLVYLETTDGTLDGQDLGKFLQWLFVRTTPTHPTGM